MKKITALFSIAVALALCACVYHQPFEQGNIITRASVQSIHPGMTSQDVVAKLGSPVLKNVYDDNRMDYIYTSQPSRNTMVIKKLVVEFHNNRVTNLRTEL
ncbi:MAG: hypothetical protein A3I77_06080 [Gammaproteobacteria bacterium RIFCSPLOWO2_02_FULL_42_14]|nr:MAG: hypothetical protein A3B71_06670 [Gammaproteobacteria bacterium RIFCSPHIGHO2_02_FULL_42_43]OGT28072.1 MAG: hypothetical protein A2624_02645 [Gammaproteobacteria bacterium RIFCSPHIGHO2_01_FULL_42_8]OGT52564.1 MAG: hypothetical protein A3E54_06275 [Gammaproteobacteria bacterium RIFCSPHIGHO2_12_FULL_41_25]OGT63162.1 MAG: hypothetical protein A3I77_06080 [Gammaproteobacteria bacterium RIFCSPLOWO2_02_FULL_42_14]OGT86662.1 MAG: hypothetical protein A3G86_04900 [Gammaproteobacteria bacterium R